MKPIFVIGSPMTYSLSSTPPVAPHRRGKPTCTSSSTTFTMSRSELRTLPLPNPKPLYRPSHWNAAMTPFADASGQAFLEVFSALNPNGFEGRFSSIASRLGLGTTLSGAEIGLLSEAAYLATLCRIAFNGLGGCKGQIKPEREPDRIRLEQSFVAACSRLWASPGWQRLALTTQDAVGRALLRPSVEDQHVAA